MKTKFMFKKGMPMLFSAMLTLFALLTATLQAAVMPPLIGGGETQNFSTGKYYYGNYEKSEPAKYASEYNLITSAQSPWDGVYLFTNGNTTSTSAQNWKVFDSYNTVETVSIASSTITSPAGAEIVIENISGTYYALSYNGNYLGDNDNSAASDFITTTTKPTSSNTTFLWTIEYSATGQATIKNVGHTAKFFKYQEGSYKKFRSTTSSTQNTTLPYLFKSASSTTPVTYTKVTSEPTDWCGDYILAYDKTSTEAWAFNGSITDGHSGYETLTVSGNNITNIGNAKKLTIEQYGSTHYYTIYIDGVGYLHSGADGFETYSTTVNFDDENNGHYCNYSIHYSSGHGMVIYSPGWNRTYYLMFMNSDASHQYFGEFATTSQYWSSARYTSLYKNTESTSSCNVTFSTPAPTKCDGTGMHPVKFGSCTEIFNNEELYPNNSPYYINNTFAQTNKVGGYVQGDQAKVEISFNTMFNNDGMDYGTVIWVDWNNDNLFTDSEVVYRGTSTVPTSTTPGTLTATFTIPSDQAEGNYTMRIGAADIYFDDYIQHVTDNYAHDPYYAGNTHAVFHDYTLHVKATGFTGYTITCNPATDGTITADAGTSSCAYETITITGNPADDCHYLSALTYNDGSDHTIEVSNNTGTFTMPEHAVTVSATFSEKTKSNYKLTVTTEGSGSATPTSYDEDLCVAPTVTLTATPSAGYKFDGWYRGNTLISTANPYDYIVPAGSTALKAKFSELVLAISPKSGIYPLGQVVTLTGPGTIYYTTDGTAPTTSSASATNIQTITLGPGITTVKLYDGTTTLTETYTVLDDNSELECSNNNGVAGTVNSGLYASKTVNFNTSTNKGTITLESFVTGTVTVTQGGVQPMDIILVLDYSGSMANHKPDGTTISGFDFSESRYIAMNSAVESFLSALKGTPSAYENDGLYHRVAFVSFNNNYGAMTYYGNNNSEDVYNIYNSNYENTITYRIGGNFNAQTDYKPYDIFHHFDMSPGSAGTVVDNPDDYYAQAFYSIPSTSGTGNSDAEWAWSKVKTKEQIGGSTSTPHGMWAAKKIVENNPTTTEVSGVTRQRMVVVLTDGQPYNDYQSGETATHWNASASATGNNVTGYANSTLGIAYDLKHNYGATFYTIGIFNTSDPTTATALPAYDDYNSSSSPHCIDRFMHLLSSNETLATTMAASTSDWSQKGCYIAAASASAITSAFQDVASQISASSNFDLSETSIVSDAISPDFVIPESALNNNEVTVRKSQATGSNYGAAQGYTTSNPCYDYITWGTPTTLTNYDFVATPNGVSVTGFNFNDNEVFYSETANTAEGIVQGWNGWKLIITIPIELAASANGQSETEVFHGNYPTNGSAGIYTSDGTQVASICSPTAYVDFGKLTWVQHVTSAPTGFALNNIDSEEDLAWAISVVNGMNGATRDDDAEITITKDLDMSAYIWVPIGYNATHPYKGTFNGNCHTIKGIRIPSESAAEYVSWRFNTGGASTDSQGNITGSGVSTGAQTSYAMGTNLVNEGFFGCLDGANINDLFVTGGLLVTDAISDVNIGGIVGYDYNSDLNTKTNINFAESAIDIVVSEGTTNAMVGGIAGSATGNLNAVMAVGDITINGTAANAGAITGTGGTVKTFYANQTISGDGAASADKNTTGSNGYCITSNDGYDMGTTGFSEPTAYTYGSYATNNTLSDGTPLVDKLNDDSNLASGYKWMRPAGSVINNDYPIIVKTTNDGSAVVNETANGKVVRYGEINELLGMEKYKKDTVSMFMYNNDTLTVAPSNTKLYIDEHVALTQADNISIPAYVGITFDNSNGVLGEESRDWHMFSSTIAAGKVGISYGSQASVYSENLHFGSDYSMMSQESDNTIYLPDGIGNGSQFDLYSFYEPQYHWINLKRAGNNHWKQDSTTVQIHYNGGGSTDSNEPTYTVGKGYLIALGDKTNANNNFMQAYGTLNNGQTNIDIPVTVSGAHLTGYNLLGNPFQSYLDFSKFATANSSIWGSESANNGYIIYDADKGGFICYGEGLMGVQPSIGSATAGQYLHPHQGFLVLAENEGTVKFNNGMRSRTASDVVFRNGQPAYPVVNLFCTDSEGNNEITVVEIERPETAGVRKPKGLLNGDGQMYARWNNTDFGLLFIDHTPDYVPMWFDAIKDAVFTMTWSTANDNFGYLHLVDNMTGADVDMLEADSYTFESHVTDMSARFRLVFKPLGIEEETTEQGENFAFFNGSELIVNGEGELSLIDLNGRVLTTQYVTGPQSAVAPPSVAEGLYLLRLTRANDVKVQKIVIRK